MSLVEILLALGGMAVALTSSYLIYRQSTKKDDNIQESTAITQVLGGYGGLVTSLEATIKRLETRIDTLEKQIAELRGALK